MDLIEKGIQVLDTGDRESDLKELEALSRPLPDEPSLKPAWERMMKSTIYMGPGDTPELINPETLYKPSFMEERMEEEEPTPPPNVDKKNSDFDLYQTTTNRYIEEGLRYTDVMNGNIDMSFAQTKAYGNQ